MTATITESVLEGTCSGESWQRVLTMRRLTREQRRARNQACELWEHEAFVLCEQSNNSNMESLILAQDER